MNSVKYPIKSVPCYIYKYNDIFVLRVVRKKVRYSVVVVTDFMSCHETDKLNCQNSQFLTR